MTMMNNNNA